MRKPLSALGDNPERAEHEVDQVSDWRDQLGSPLARLTCIALLSAALLAAPPAPKASAALVLRFDPPKAPPGTEVSAETIGGRLPRTPETLPLFLAPAKAKRIEAPTDPRLSPIGELVYEPFGVGRLTFTVPDVAAGPYMAVAPTSGEKGVFTAGTVTDDPFRVTAADPEGGRALDSGSGNGGLPTGVVIALVAAGVLLAGAGAVLVARGFRNRASPR